jgi:hypothetical protein
MTNVRTADVLAYRTLATLIVMIMASGSVRFGFTTSSPSNLANKNEISEKKWFNLSELID